jgi:NosR/NirI family transcriptional regulator, nitrous oxide reductase regulator
VNPAETWGEILRPQALDLVLLTAFIGFALVSFFRKSRRLKYVALVVAVGYMGFVKSSLVSISDVFRLTDLSLPPFKYSLAWYLFSGFVVASTVLWGRLYCGRICAYGALTQLLDAVVPARVRVDIPVKIERRAAWIKYALLGGVVIYYLVTHDLASPVQYVEPFWMFTLFGTRAMWIGLALLLAATIFVRNLYCRFLCPVGAALGILSNLTVFRIKRWSECKTCKICERTCEWGAIRGPRIVKTECVRCDDCERLYLDQQKCPHWIVLRRKGNAFISA